jgi:hypothetical protein
MKSSLKSFPDGVYGELALNIKTILPVWNKIHLDLHFVATLEESGKSRQNVKLHLYSLDRRTSGRRLRAKHLGTLPFPATMLTSLGKEAADAQSAVIKRFIWGEFEKWWGEQDKDKRECEYCEILHGTVINQELSELFLPEFAMPGTGEMVYPEFMHTKIPTGLYGSPDVPYVSPIPKAAPVVRLSKEDWLKQHYPEMSELPKWRFPSVAG